MTTKKAHEPRRKGLRRPVLAELREAFHHNRDLDRLRSLWSHAPGPILDLGTGAGRIALALAQCGAETVGINIDAEAIDAARRRAAERLLSAEFARADARTYCMDRRFSWIIGGSFFEHVELDEDFARVLSNAREMLAPGGSIVLSLALEAFHAGHVGDTSSNRRVVSGHVCKRVVEIKDIAADRIVYSIVYCAPALSVEQKIENVLRLRSIRSFLDIAHAARLRVRKSYDGATTGEATSLSSTATFVLVRS